MLLLFSLLSRFTGTERQTLSKRQFMNHDPLKVFIPLNVLFVYIFISLYFAFAMLASCCQKYVSPNLKNGVSVQRVPSL